MDLYSLKKKRGKQSRERQPLLMIGFSVYLRQMSENLGLDNHDLMRATGVTPRTLNGWRENTVAPQRDVRKMLVRIAELSDRLSEQGLDAEAQKALMDMPVEMVIKLSPKELFFLNRLDELEQVMERR